VNHIDLATQVESIPAEQPIEAIKLTLLFLEFMTPQKVGFRIPGLDTDCSSTDSEYIYHLYVGRWAYL